jgi:hypothetical protein
MAFAHTLREDAHALVHARDVRPDVGAIDHHPFVTAQRRVQDGAVLGGVDALPREKPLDTRRDAPLTRELREEREGLRGDALLRQVDRDARSGKGELLPAPRIGLPQRRNACSGKGFAVREERAPRGRLGGR